MCGIAGLVGRIERRIAENAVHKMVAVLERRGPDDEGIESWDEAVLGHRRLAIFDLSSAGRQPMLSADRSIGVVFNGAIYNYRELRAELISRGYLFNSNTDTEVLVNGYRHWGLDRLVSKLRGMFAFGLWDNSTRKLYLVRDRLGVKPLVFSVRNGCIAFASTVRALRLAGYADELNEDAMLEFLELGFVTEEHSIYRAVAKVRAGSIVEWANGCLKVGEYWTPPDIEATSTYSFSDAVEKTEQLLLDSVAVRLRADVPVGALLSGGIDSGLVCWALKKLGANITAYSVAVPDDPWDETNAARKTAQMLGIEHRLLEMSDRDSLDMTDLVSAYAEPFACASALGMLRLSQAVASSAKVLLTGDGGDDVFLGYPSHRHLWLATELSRTLPTSIKSAWLASRSVFPRIGPLRRAAALFDYTTGDLSPFFGNSAPGIHRCLLGDRLKCLVTNSPSKLRDENCPSDEVFQDYLNYERRTRFVAEYLTKVDGATMHYALEARSPFLDQFIWEFASTLPVSLRLHNGRLKSILRELARQKMGYAIANRRKRGFGIPVQRWIVGQWRTQVEATFHDAVLDREGWIRSDSVLADLALATRYGSAPRRLWYLFTLESWLKHETSQQ